MNVVIVSQLGQVYDVYTENKFIDMVNELYIDNSLEDTKDDKITDIEECIEWFVETAYRDDCLTVDLMEVQE